MFMRIDAKVGAIAGLITGIVFALILQIFAIRTPAGNRVLLMQVLGGMTGTKGLVVSWAFHLFDSALMGAIFGALVGPRFAGYDQGLKYGALCGIVWWALGGFFMLPIFLGLSVFSASTLEPIGPVAVESLITQVIFGLVFGAVFVALRDRQMRKLGAIDTSRERQFRGSSKAA
jgi:xanthosine utilization system XapX-like protein